MSRRTDTPTAPGTAGDSLPDRQDPVDRVFPAASRRERRRLRSLLTPVHVVSGTTVFAAGDPARELVWVARGRLEVRRDGHRVAELSAGDPAGELALLAGPSTARSADVVCTDDAELLVATPQELATVLADCPTVAESLSKVAALRQS